MAGSINKATLVGNLGRDPEARTMSNGGEVVSFSVATTDSWKDANGERQERVEWHNVVIFNEGLGKVARQYLRKGSKVYIEGAIQSRKWQDRDGNERTTTEIVLQKYRGELVLLDGKRDAENVGSSNRQSGSSAYSPPAADDLDDDVPF